MAFAIVQLSFPTSSYAKKKGTWEDWNMQLLVIIYVTGQIDFKLKSFKLGWFSIYFIS